MQNMRGGSSSRVSTGRTGSEIRVPRPSPFTKILPSPDLGNRRAFLTGWRKAVVFPWDDFGRRTLKARLFRVVTTIRSRLADPSGPGRERQPASAPMTVLPYRLSEPRWTDGRCREGKRRRGPAAGRPMSALVLLENEQLRIIVDPMVGGTIRTVEHRELGMSVLGKVPWKAEATPIDPATVKDERVWLTRYSGGLADPVSERRRCLHLSAACFHGFHGEGLDRAPGDMQMDDRAITLRRRFQTVPVEVGARDHPRRRPVADPRDGPRHRLGNPRP